MQSSAPPVNNWEALRQRILSDDRETTLAAILELKTTAVRPPDLPLLLSALIPSVLPLVTSKTTPNPDVQSTEHKIRAAVLAWISKLPLADAVRRYTPALVAVSMDVLRRDYEDNAVTASRILFSIFKNHRSLPSESVEPYVKFVLSLYQDLPQSSQKRFSTIVPSSQGGDAMDVESTAIATKASVDSSSTTQPPSQSTSSFRVLAECPLVVILIFQLYPQFSKAHVPVLIKVMVEALDLRPPFHSTLSQLDKPTKRLYVSALRDLVAAQAKTLSFLTFFLRTFSSEIKQYNERLATNVVAIMTTCPRESISTRRELLVATRHLLNSDFRAGFFRHMDALLDERVLTGNRAVLKPLAYTMLSDLVHHTRTLLPMKQMNRVVGVFCRVLHDTALPTTTQHASIRTLLNLVELLLHNKDPNPQLGRDMLVRLLYTFIDKLDGLQRQQQDHKNNQERSDNDNNNRSSSSAIATTTTAADIPGLMRVVIVGLKTIIHHLARYRSHRSSSTTEASSSSAGANEEVHSAHLKLTQTELHLLRRYLTTALPALRQLQPFPELQREALTYCAAALTALDGLYLRRVLGGLMDVLVDATVLDPACMVIPRHLLGANATTSLVFCSILLDYLVDRMELLCWEPAEEIVFVSDDNSSTGQKAGSQREHVVRELHRIQQKPQMSIETRKTISSTHLQLFERILKSLSVYAENESVVRRYLKRIVSCCLQLSMENIGQWPENYCMLLRYIFRSISAGKFEESYKELLPLIPTVLNGLYRIICSCEDSILRNTAIELCLTIPARLSSLLPHMNLLLRIIIPALDSNVAELVNLGLRTLEFWVDNLNPLFLYPEMSKQKELFSQLMQTLSRHLRPAPYQYGLLTVRLLGKLGGRNRQFLRDPMTIVEHRQPTTYVDVACNWKAPTDVETTGSEFKVPLSLNDCVDMLKSMALSVEINEEVDKNALDASLNSSTASGSKFDSVDLVRKTTEISLLVRSDQISACFGVLRVAVQEILNRSSGPPSNMSSGDRLGLEGLLFSSLIPPQRDESIVMLKNTFPKVNPKVIGDCLSQFSSEPNPRALPISIELFDYILSLKEQKRFASLDGDILSSLCEYCCVASWCRQEGPQALLCHAVHSIGYECAKQYEEILMSAAFVPLKTIPRELSSASVRAFGAFVRLCSSLYGDAWQKHELEESQIVWDTPFHLLNQSTITDSPPGGIDHPPGEIVLRLLVRELTSPQHLVRIAAKFFLRKFVVLGLDRTSRKEIATKYVDLIRQTIFSRSLRLLPLPHQVGIVEALTAFVSEFPDLLPLDDQHLLACISELLKMANVADREMEDSKLDGRAVDKDGFIFTSSDSGLSRPSNHATSLFFRRNCVLKSDARLVFLPGELPAAVELRSVTIVFLHTVIKAHLQHFFEAESSSAIGSIRPHVIGLLFRSLTAEPLRTVDLAHTALSDIVALGVEQHGSSSTESPKTQPKLPKELLQRSIRPVLLHLREHKRLTVPLLRGLSRLLSLLSTWFNKTLGEKLLDHLQKWASPATIIASKIWEPGEEPLVAAEIVGIFASLPHAAHFVEDLVKTCLKLESSLHSYKGRSFIESPYRRPLARYLNKHAHHAVSFFFPRLKTPMYSELFQFILRLEEESVDLRRYLEVKQCTRSILNVCFERPLAILRSEKNSNPAPSPTDILLLHGIGSTGTPQALENVEKRGMGVESMEQQFQGFRIVEVLMAHNTNYFAEHNDIIRAFRYLWRSRGRFLRLQHEDAIPPRFYEESRLLTTFLISHSRAFQADDMEVFFELSRAFLQPSSTDFGLVRRFLLDNVTKSMPPGRWEKVFDLFYQYMAKDSTDEFKILGIQCVVLPMVESRTNDGLDNFAGEKIKGIIDRFMKEVIFPDGRPLPCGERLRVELLRLTKLFVKLHAEEMKPYKTELMQFCWGLLKSEDLSSKSWAYAVVCQLIHSYEMPKKFIKQTFVSLMKCHQQEGKELIREALNSLIPTIPKHLNETEQNELLDQTNQLILEDGNSGCPQAAHVFRTVVCNPEFFSSRQASFKKPMTDALSRIVLATNATVDNRSLAVAMAERLVAWGDSQTSSASSTLLQLSIRLKLTLAGGSQEARNSEAGVSSSQQLGERLNVLLEKVFSFGQFETSLTMFEKVAGSDPKSSAAVVACLEILSIAIKKSQNATLDRNTFVIRDIVLLAIERARDHPDLEASVQSLIGIAKSNRSITQFLLVGLERSACKAASELQREAPVGRGLEHSRRSRDRSSNVNSHDENSSVTRYGLTALEAIAGFCMSNRAHFNTIVSSLLSLAKTVSNVHLSEASARQRHGAAANKTTSIGSKFHTPTVGILEESILRESRMKSPRARSPVEDVTNTKAVEFLASILGNFDSSDVIFLSAQTRKSLLQLLINIFESSDSVRLLLYSVKILGRFLLADDPSSPLTPRERTSLIGRLATFDFGNLPNSIESQILADHVYALTVKLPRQSYLKNHGAELGKLMIACLLNARPTARRDMLEAYFSLGGGNEFEHSFCGGTGIAQSMWRLFHSDFEGLGGRFWVVLIVDTLCMSLEFSGRIVGRDLGVLCHGNTGACLEMLGTVLPSAWRELENNSQRVRLLSSLETLLSRSYHFQFLRCQTNDQDPRCNNVVRSLLSLVLKLSPIPVLNTQLLLSLAENYNSWHEVIQLLQVEYKANENDVDENSRLASAVRHCYKFLGEDDMWLSWSKPSCKSGRTAKALSLDSYGLIEDAANEYSELMELAEAPDATESPTMFEMDLWEERWVLLQKELCQSHVVSEFANLSESPFLQLECAWKAQEWSKVRSLCSSSALFAAVESGDPKIKMCETILAVANGRLTDVENLHAQTAQLCLYRWQLLPKLSSTSRAHSSLYHFFHRLVEIRESGQIMVETNNHASARTIPDLKNLLSAWRHRLPNDWENMSMWEEIFAWRSHMFSAITSNFSWSEANTLATLHDRPWSSVRMAKTARKHGLRETGLLLLSQQTTDERAINIPDAFLKLRERVLTYYNPESKIERHGGLNLLNLSNLSFFDAPQKSELFRLKAMFLQSLQGRAKANQAYCHSVQICPSNARAWLSWGELCASLANSIEKQQAEQTAAMSTEKAKDSAKKVRQYLSQAMGCFLESMNIDGHEWSRIHIPKCLWMLTKDGSSGSLAQTFEKRATHIPAWVWLPWIPQLLTSLYRKEGRAVKTVFSRLVMAYPQAVYYPLRAFYLERRDVDRGGKATNKPNEQTQPQESVTRAEELMSLLRKSHASLWSALESVLEELIVKFRPSNEEDLLATIVVLLDRTSLRDSLAKKEEEAAVQSIWKTLGKIAVKYFRASNQVSPSCTDLRTKRAVEFKEKYKAEFERDFQVSSVDSTSPETQSPVDIDEIAKKLREWKEKLEAHVATFPTNLSLIESSSTLAMFGCDAPDLWPGACDPQHVAMMTAGRENVFDGDPGSQTTSASAAAAMKAAKSAANAVTSAAKKEGIGGDYGGGSSWIEIPGQYMPNSNSWTDGRPSPELHAKLLRFEPPVALLRRNDTLVRRIGMVGSDGTVHRFLLQFALPYLTRTDERTAQTYFTFDKVFQKHVQSSRAQISAQPDSVIPVAQRLRLVVESNSRASLDDICCRGSRQPLQGRFTDMINDKLKERNGGAEPPNKEVLRATRCEVFGFIRSLDNIDDDTLTKFITQRCQSPENLYHFRRVFAQQWAINCLLQYAFSSGDRSPAKVAFDCSDARVFSPEFRIAYNHQGCFETQPAPFRLSPNISRFIGPTMLDARFIRSMAIAADAVYACRHDIDPIFRLLIRDDLVSYYNKGAAKADLKTLEMESKLLPSVGRNVATMHTRFSECAPSYKLKESTEGDQEIDHRTRKLVLASQHPANQCMMPVNYQGWI